MNNMSEIPSHSAFVKGETTIVNQLLHTITVVNGDKRVSATALFDTGATNTCISDRIVKSLDLISTGEKDTGTANGPITCNTYLVDIELPNQVTVQGVEVANPEINNSVFDVLIGMDILNLGDFAISNFEGKTTFTLRIPSIRKTDYVDEIEKLKIKQRIPVHGKGNTRKRHGKKG